MSDAGGEKRRYFWYAFAVLGVLAVGGMALLLVVVLGSGLGTSLDRSDFRTEPEALAFVSDHLPAPRRSTSLRTG